MAFDRFNDKPPRREKRDGDNFGSRKGSRFEDSGRERGFGRGEGRFGDRPEGRFGERKSFAGRPFREELGGRSGPRAKAVDKRRFSDRAAYASNATVRLEEDVAKYFKSAEEVNAALRLVIELTKTVRADEAPVQEAQASEDADAAEVETTEEAVDEADEAPTPEAEPKTE